MHLTALSTAVHWRAIEEAVVEGFLFFGMMYLVDLILHWWQSSMAAGEESRKPSVKSVNICVGHPQWTKLKSEKMIMTGFFFFLSLLVNMYPEFSNKNVMKSITRLRSFCCADSINLTDAF